MDVLCGCGQPVEIKKAGLCKRCYYREWRAKNYEKVIANAAKYRDQMRAIREAARASGKPMIAAAGWQRPPAQTPEERRRKHADDRRERYATDPEYRTQRLAKEREYRQRPEVRTRRNEQHQRWYRKAMQNPVYAQHMRERHRISDQRRKPLRKPKPTPEELEARRQQRATDYQMRLLFDPEFREQELAKRRAKTRAKNLRRRERMKTDPEYRERMKAKKREYRRRHWANDPAYRAKKSEKERERRARRRAEQTEE